MKLIVDLNSIISEQEKENPKFYRSNRIIIDKF